VIFRIKINFEISKQIVIVLQYSMRNQLGLVKFHICCIFHWKDEYYLLLILDLSFD